MGHKAGTPDTEKVRFYSEMACEWDLESSGEIIASLGNFNRYVGKCANGFESVPGGMVLRKEMWKKQDCWTSVIKKKLCVANAWFYKEEKRKISHNAGECKIEIDFVLVGKNTESK